MHNDSFPFAHLVLHLIVAWVAASRRARRGTNTARSQRQEPKTVCMMPPGFQLRTNQDRGVTKPKGKTMKPVIRYRTQSLPQRSYKPSRMLRIRPVKMQFIFRPVRFGVKPKITDYEFETD